MPEESSLLATPELRTQSKEFKRQNDFENASICFRLIWEREPNNWNGFYYAQSLRKANKFSEARQLHQLLEESYPPLNALKTEWLWLDYNEKIKNWKNPSLISDAE